MIGGLPDFRAGGVVVAQRAVRIVVLVRAEAAGNRIGQSFGDLVVGARVVRAGVGTGGTISGTGKYLKEASNGAVKVIGSDPEGSIYSASSRDEVHQYDIEGVGEDFYPKAFDRNITDDIVRVSDAEAFEMTRRLAGEEALLVGGSSGMAVASAIKYALANDLDENQIVVVLAPDSGRSYLEKIFNDDWMRANGYGDIVERTSKPSLAEQYLNGTPSDEGAADGLHN